MAAKTILFSGTAQGPRNGTGATERHRGRSLQRQDMEHYFPEPYKQLLVMEAKLGSKLSAGTKNAPGYNQAARNVACMAKMIHSKGKPVSEYKSLGFYVVAPDIVLKEEKSFGKFMDRQDIRSSVERKPVFLTKPDCHT